MHIYGSLCVYEVCVSICGSVCVFVLMKVCVGLCLYIFWRAGDQKEPSIMIQLERFWL